MSGHDDFRARLLSRVTAVGLPLENRALEALTTYFGLLSHWNRRLNLSGFDLDRLQDHAIDRLFVEPLFAAAQLASPESFIDIGSGGGSPAIPMMVVLRPARAVLVEIRERKCVFLQEALRVLGLLGTARVERSRFESTAVAFPESFDLATSRAVRLGPSELHSVGSLVRPGGTVCVFGGNDALPQTPSLQPDRTILLPDPLRGTIQLLRRR